MLQRTVLVLLIATLLCPTTLWGQERTLPEQQQELWASFALKGQLPSVFSDMIGEEARKRIRLLEQEVEVLRRAAAYLSQANLPGKGSTRS